MKKSVQKVMNDYSRQLWAHAWELAFPNGASYHYEDEERLLSCKATTFWRGGSLWLRSYNTVVAVYMPDDDEFLDMSRYVYGYTATTSQHIAKFYHEVCKMAIVQPNYLRYKD